MKKHTVTLSDIYLELQNFHDQGNRVSSFERVLLYWKIGEFIHLNVCGKKSADCDMCGIEDISNDLVKRYGNAYKVKYLRKMERLYSYYPLINSILDLSKQLTWSHFVELLSIENDLYYNLYVDLCKNERWSSKCLHNRIEWIKSLQIRMKSFFLNNDLNKDDSFTWMVAMNDEKDLDLLLFHRELYCLIPVVLVIGKFNTLYLPQIESYLQIFKLKKRQKGEGEPIGIVLCVDGDSTSIRLFQLDTKGIKTIIYPKEFPPKELIELELRQWYRSEMEYLRNKR